MNQESGTQSMAGNGKATTTKSTFSRETTVSIGIAAESAVVWALLTNASDYPRWNSTVVSIEGEIETGGEIKLVSTLDESRTFNLKVKEVVPEKRLVWGDRMGDRVYTIASSEGGVTFTMTEKIGGLLFPLFAGQIPSFDEAFEQFAADLKKEAEGIDNGEL